MYEQSVVESSNGIINFGIGRPRNDLLPLDIFKFGLSDIINNEHDKSILHY